MRLLHVALAVTIPLSVLAMAQSTPSSLLRQSIATHPPASLDPATQTRIAERTIAEHYGKLPLSFEANIGQTDSSVKYLSRTREYSLFLTGDEAVLAFTPKLSAKNTKFRAGPGFPRAAESPKTLRMKLLNANASAPVTGLDELPGASNYFIGNDPARWRTNAPTYSKVKYQGIYSGIDLVYYGNQRQLEYDFIVAAGADPRRIEFDIRGTERITQDVRGDLIFKIGGDEIRWHKPAVFQEKDGERQPVAAKYAITGKNRVGFELANYDASRPLFIDPLIYSTYLGGSGDDYSYGIAVDAAGNAYVTGYTNSVNFPTTTPLQPVNDGGDADAFICKINPSGTAFLYSTYLGGSDFDFSFGIAVDAMGNAYIAGVTGSIDFPILNALQPTFNGGSSDAFVAKLNPNGTALVYSTYLGGEGTDWGQGIAIDSTGAAYVIGYTSSTNFPTEQPVQGTYGGGNFDAFVAKLNPVGSALVYSTYLGGSGNDWGYGIAVDNAGNAYTAGQTDSANFPTTILAFQKTCNGGKHCSSFGDAFVSKLNPAGSTLAYSTYLGGSGIDVGNSIAVDAGGYAYVAGVTSSTDFPTSSPLQPAFGGGFYDAFVAKLNPAATALVYSTYLGGNGTDYAYGIAVDSRGSPYLTGWTSSTNFPTVSSTQKNRRGSEDSFLTRLNPAGTTLVFSTYLGGRNGSSQTVDLESGWSVAVDGSSNAYVAGFTDSPDFPTKNPLQPVSGGGVDAFVAKFNTAAATTTVISSSPNPSIEGQLVTFTTTISSSLGTPPNGETVTLMQGTSVVGMSPLIAGSASFTTSALSPGKHTIKAAYIGDSNYASSSSKVIQVVAKSAP